MKKMTFILVYLLLLCTAINTKAEGVMALVLSTNDGNDATFILSEKPEITFANHTLTINVKNDNNVFEISNVKQIHFDIIDAIHSPRANTISYSYLSDNLILIEGVGTHDRILLYTLAGILIPNRVNLTDGRAEVSLASLQKGTYLLKIGNKQTIKIYKK